MKSDWTTLVFTMFYSHDESLHEPAAKRLCETFFATRPSHSEGTKRRFFANVAELFTTIDQRNPVAEEEQDAAPPHEVKRETEN